MNAHHLNQSGAKIQELKQGDRVYFYRPPSQQEVIRRGRKAKHLAHYHGPAIIQGKVDGRDRQYHLTYDGKPFKRDISMLVPEKEMQRINPETHDPTITPITQSSKTFHSRERENTCRRGSHPVQDGQRRHIVVPRRSPKYSPTKLK